MKTPALWPSMLKVMQSLNLPTFCRQRHQLCNNFNYEDGFRVAEYAREFRSALLLVLGSCDVVHKKHYSILSSSNYIWNSSQSCIEFKYLEHFESMHGGLRQRAHYE